MKEYQDHVLHIVLPDSRLFLAPQPALNKQLTFLTCSL